MSWVADEEAPAVEESTAGAVLMPLRPALPSYLQSAFTERSAYGVSC